MKAVWILGAGASFGDRLSLVEHIDEPVLAANAKPPLTTGFFQKEFFDSLGYEVSDIGADFKNVFDFVRWLMRIDEEPIGEGRWKNLNIEDLFTSIELGIEFFSDKWGTKAHYLLLRSEFLRFIQRVVGQSTLNKYGEYSRKLVANLTGDSTLITFNWDLLLDQEFGYLEQRYHYYNFLTALTAVPDYSNPIGPKLRSAKGSGLFLKLHGSLNWDQCTNNSCLGHSQIHVSPLETEVLDRSIGLHWTDEHCVRCGSDLVPLIVPPIHNKKISEDPVVRASWGLAKRELQKASKVVIIGFSVAPTDFYATWLLRSTVGTRDDVDVFVVNPSNNGSSSGDINFQRRMESIFPLGYRSDFSEFSEIEAILERVYEKPEQGEMPVPS